MLIYIDVNNSIVWPIREPKGGRENIYLLVHVYSKDLFIIGFEAVIEKGKLGSATTRTSSAVAASDEIRNQIRDGIGLLDVK